MIAAQIAPSPTDPLPLTEEESQEREQLLEQGFSNWNRRDFTSFVRACERYGRQAIPEITKEIEGKTEEEVCFAAALMCSSCCMLNTSQTLQLVLRNCITSWRTGQVTLEPTHWARFAKACWLPLHAETSIF